MWIYEKKLIYPVMVTRPDPAMARRLQMLLGGASGEFTASTTYLNQRYCMPVSCVRALLTDIGREASEMFLSEAPAFFDAFATV